MLWPRCQGGRRDHVDVGWFQATSTVLNGQCLRKSLACCAWIPWVTIVSQFLVAAKRSMLVVALSLSMLVG